MNDIKNLWVRTSAGGRLGLIAGAVLIIVAVAAMGYWSFRKQYEALFTDLAEQDAATLIAELDRMKVPYRLEAGGKRIMVPEEMVHKTRLQLVGKNLPLHGSVGFEIFNNTDFGMTEFNQRVNYQRALQGELTRTIMAIEEVQAARVHLVMAESTLFKREQNKPKASVTLTLRPGQTLAHEQVIGIQRLVAAAVPGIDVADVTVLDQKGTTLSRARDAGGEQAAWQLEIKHEIEKHLARKAAAVLDLAYGPGQSLVSVDVTLNFDHVKTTTEETLGSSGSKGAAPSGVIVRERQTVRETPVAAKEGAATPATVESAVTQSDVEYQPGRRVEQIVTEPGSVHRINVAVVLPKGVSVQRSELVRELVAAAVGLDPKRGDMVAVQSLDQLSAGASAPIQGLPNSVEEQPRAADSRAPSPKALASQYRVEILGGMLLAALALLALMVRRRRPAAVVAPIPAAATPLTEPERQALLDNVQRWLVAADTTQANGSVR